MQTMFTLPFGIGRLKMLIGHEQTVIFLVGLHKVLLLLCVVINSLKETLGIRSGMPMKRDVTLISSLHINKHSQTSV